MPRLNVSQCDRCSIRKDNDVSLPNGWTEFYIYKPTLTEPVILLCIDCTQAFEAFMKEIEKAARPE